MTDIVERLRRKVFHGPTMEAVHTKTLEWEAAAEIERLTNELHIAQEWSARVIAGCEKDAAEIIRLTVALNRLADEPFSDLVSVRAYVCSVLRRGVHD